MPMPAASTGEAPPKPRQKKKPPRSFRRRRRRYIDSLRSSLEKDRQEPLIEFEHLRSQSESEKRMSKGFVHDDDETAGGGTLSPTRKPRKKRQPTAAPAPGTQENPSSEPAIAAETAAAPVESSQQQLPPLNLNEKFEKPKAAAAAAGAATAEAEPEVEWRSRRRPPPPPRSSSSKQKKAQQTKPEESSLSSRSQSAMPPPPATDAAAASTSRRFDAAGIADEGLIVRLRVASNRPVENDTHIRHPRVRVHVVDTQAAATWPSRHPDRKVTSFYESVSFLLPVMTGECDFRRQGNTLPSRGWLYRVAWAFLRPHSLAAEATAAARSVYSYSKRCRCASPNRPIRGAGTCSTGTSLALGYPIRRLFYVTVEEFSPNRNNEQVAGRTRSQFRVSKQEGLGLAGRGRRGRRGRGRGGAEAEPRHRADYFQRVPGQLCKIPNKAARTLPNGHSRMLSVALSPDGRCGLPQPAAFRQWITAGAVLLHCRRGAGRGPALLAGKPEFNLLGHAGIVYDLGWSTQKSHVWFRLAEDCSA
uniref:C2 domain-containing protein n=1 Tax=Macrostomum lignano TaxID=282301 RepID=A0A1I8FH89_9PLAT